jgi:hypothetical protein
MTSHYISYIFISLLFFNFLTQSYIFILRLVTNIEKEGVTPGEAMSILRVAIANKIDSSDVYSAVSIFPKDVSL